MLYKLNIKEKDSELEINKENNIEITSDFSENGSDLGVD